jgi:hypothetical protein
MEHLLATMVSVPPSLGWMPSRGIMEHLLARWLVYPHHLCRSGRLRLSFFIKASDADPWARHYFSELKLASLKYYTP